MLEPVPHDVPVNLRPCGVRFPNDESVSGDDSQTVDEPGTEWGAEVVQPQFVILLLVQRDVWVSRFREHFMQDELNYSRLMQITSLCCDKPSDLDRLGRKLECCLKLFQQVFWMQGLRKEFEMMSIRVGGIQHTCCCGLP